MRDGDENAEKDPAVGDEHRHDAVHNDECDEEDREERKKNVMMMIMMRDDDDDDDAGDDG